MRQEDSKLESLREYARTTVLEPEVDSNNETQNETSVSLNVNMFSSDTLNDNAVPQNALKKQSLVAQNFTPMQKFEDVKNNQSEKLAALKKSVYQKSQMEKQGEADLKNEETEFLEEEPVVDALFAESLSIEETNDTVLEEEVETYTKSDNKNYKFRLRLLTGVFCLVVAVLGGWIIGNIVQISSTTSEITTATEYSVNLKDLIKNISKTDKDDQPASPSDGTLLPIEEIIPITPQPLEDTTAYEEESNWFDKICNWFKNLFGG